MNPRKRRLLKIKAAQAATVAEEAAPVVEKKVPAKATVAPKKAFGRKKTVE